jgi:hypothetical protein
LARKARRGGSIRRAIPIIWSEPTQQGALVFYPNNSLLDYMAAHLQGQVVWTTLERLLPTLQTKPPSIVHLDYWPEQLLWCDGRIVAAMD